jgi:phenylalanine ammonia-lyase
MLAHTQVTTELNSTSDNPLVDVSHSDIHSGGNFQAASITAAMEKARLSLQMIGKMLFSQCTELINPALNNGLPANLAADDPSLSFGMKGIDVNVAAYMSELAYLANPISNHVQSAEQHNQAINSLAFISARYTMDAVDLVSLISASFIYVGC